MPWLEFEYPASEITFLRRTTIPSIYVHIAQRILDSNGISSVFAIACILIGVTAGYSAWLLVGSLQNTSEIAAKLKFASHCVESNYLIPS